MYLQSPMTTNSFQGPFLAIPLWAVEVIKDYGQPRDLQVLVGLVALMDRRQREVTASVQQIADHVGVSKETTKRSLKWLSEYGVVTTRRRKNPSINVYTVHYTDAQMGSRVTLDGVMGDPIKSLDGVMGDPIDNTGGVTGDPSNSPQTRMAYGFPEGSIEVLNIETLLIEKLERAASGEGDEMIIGADPNDMKHEEQVKPTKAPPRKTNRLLSHFVSNRQSIMSANYNQRDLIILRRTFNLLTDSGLSEFTVMQMINKFLSVERWRTAENPALLFCSKEIQKELMEHIEVAISTDDPILLLMLNDFDRTGIDLQWDAAQDNLLKKAIVMRGTDICYRYPEVVSALAMQYKGDFGNENFVNGVTTLNSLIRFITGEEQEDPTVALNSLRGFPLPDELLKMSKSLLRSPASSITEAVYNYRRLSNGK